MPISHPGSIPPAKIPISYPQPNTPMDGPIPSGSDPPPCQHTARHEPIPSNRHLLDHTQQYLACLQEQRTPTQEQEAAWTQFFLATTATIHRFARNLNVPAADLEDCVQEAWRELVVRLPQFQLDDQRGRFETWLYRIVQSKVINLHRSRKRTAIPHTSDYFTTLPESTPDASEHHEDRELLILLLSQLRNRLSPCTYQILHLRLVELQSVHEVAAALNLSKKQVWYRCHRAKRNLQRLVATLRQ